MSKRDVRLLVEDMIESGEKIQEYTYGLSFDDFIKDKKTVDAVVRNFAIIGEAGTRLSDEFKNNHSEVDWARIKGLRNRIIHDYFGIDLKIVWNIKENYLPAVISILKESINNKTKF